MRELAVSLERFNALTLPVGQKRFCNLFGAQAPKRLQTCWNLLKSSPGSSMGLYGGVF